MRFSGKITALCVFMTSYLIKEYRIERGNYLIWDEAHFIKFSNYYLQRKFYFDVHPPLGKMLTAIGGLLAEQKGDYKDTTAYPNDFDYAMMRRLHAFMGSFCPLFAYLILRKIGFSLARSFVCSLLFIFDNGFTSISRIVLLDPHLLSFIAGTTYYMVALYGPNQRTGKYRGKSPHHGSPGGTASYISRDILPNSHATASPRHAALSKTALFGLGCMLGCVISVKWIGCLTMLLVGLFVIYDLYQKLLCYQMRSLLRDFILYSVFLIGLPILIYMGTFFVHFHILRNSGDGDGSMSIPFQMRLLNNPLRKTRKYIEFGKQVTIHGEGYLHSHKHEYPTSAPVEEEEKSFQTTAYGAKDSNNNFYFQKVSDSTEVTFLENNDEVVLHHAEATCYLGIDGLTAYVGKGRRVVCKEGVPMTHSVWILERASKAVDPKVSALTDKFRLLNREAGCYISASGEVYPPWGYGQGEILCQPEQDKATLWTVEENLWSDEVNNPLHHGLSKSFLGSFLELNKEMHRANKGLKTDESLEPDHIISRPTEWPILRRGLRMTQWTSQYKFYMFANPFLFYCSTLCLFLSPLCFLLDKIRLSRAPDGSRERKKLQRRVARDAFFLPIAIGGWAIHYLAFFCVGRVLYFHHYFPPYFFSLLLLCHSLRRTRILLVLFVALVILFYCLYSPLTYGFLDAKKMSFLKLLPTWDFTD